MGGQNNGATAARHASLRFAPVLLGRRPHRYHIAGQDCVPEQIFYDPNVTQRNELHISYLQFA
jgi:hypothetical protein